MSYFTCKNFLKILALTLWRQDNGLHDENFNPCGGFVAIVDNTVKSDALAIFQHQQVTDTNSLHRGSPRFTVHSNPSSQSWAVLSSGVRGVLSSESMVQQSGARSSLPLSSLGSTTVPCSPQPCGQRLPSSSGGRARTLANWMAAPTTNTSQPIKFHQLQSRTSRQP